MASGDHTPAQRVGNNLRQQVALLARQFTPEVIARLEQLAQRDEAWIMRPVLERVCNYADLINGTLDFVDVERLNRALDLRDQQRERERAERDQQRQRERAERDQQRRREHADLVQAIATVLVGRAELSLIDDDKETTAGAGDVEGAASPSDTKPRMRRRPDNTKRQSVEIWLAEEQRRPDFVVPSMSELPNLKRRYRNSRRGKKSSISDKHLLRVLKGLIEEHQHDQ